jgi:hypothetical protein
VRKSPPASILSSTAALIVWPLLPDRYMGPLDGGIWLWRSWHDRRGLGGRVAAARGLKGGVSSLTTLWERADLAWSDTVSTPRTHFPH